MSEAAETVPISAAEEPAAMLEVHAPHDAPHSWKDFFIHIATITTGLLIAVGLEQTVEYVHHRFQAAEMAARLHAESLQNHEMVLIDLRQADSMLQALAGNIAALEAIRAGGDKTAYVPSALPLLPIYAPEDTVWLMMRDSALLPVVPDLLVQNYWKLEAANEVFTRRRWDADGSQTQLQALLLTYGKIGVLSPPQREALERAYYEYEENLVRFRKLMADYDMLNALALANQPISPQAVNKDFGS